MLGFLESPKQPKMKNISVVDYLSNKGKCSVCGEKRFFSTSKQGKTDKLQCGQCDTIYLRNYNTNQFEIQ